MKGIAFLLLVLVLMSVLVATPVMAQQITEGFAVGEAAVGGEVVPISGTSLIAYWGVLALIIAAGVTYLVRRIVHNRR
jgi:hypothetical protein